MVADFAYYHLNTLSGKLNWSRKNSMQRSISWTKTTKADDKEYNNLKLVDLQSKAQPGFFKGGVTEATHQTKELKTRAVDENTLQKNKF